MTKKQSKINQAINYTKDKADAAESLAKTVGLLRMIDPNFKLNINSNIK